MRLTLSLSLLVINGAFGQELFAGTSAALGDPHAGYVLNLKQPQEWVSEISYSPGITSKLCIERIQPSMIMCIQSLQRAIELNDRTSLAQGFFTAIDERYPPIGVTEPAPAEHGQLQGLQRSFETAQESLPSKRRQVFLFAGTNTSFQPQLAIAFTDPADTERARQQFTNILASIVYQNSP